MSQEKTYQAPANRQDILPETGAKETATLASLGAVGALLGLAAMGKKKEDEQNLSNSRNTFEKVQISWEVIAEQQNCLKKLL